ncbi:hypothetical protein Bca52824_003614 [Brassica carinata]|uniref:MLO-like protein n=1 Tax=Brassica carinata TaxID=52824 RepID=A0A8X7WMD3_BRACI|nr:hypothetical protein Bca52824_003614 [Brassica carinata]
MAIKDRSLEETPTWALAAVCFVILFISIMIEYFLHYIGHWFKRKNKKALYEALEKVKAGKFLLFYKDFIIISIFFYLNFQLTFVCFWFWFVVKIELMLLGFISLLLVVLQSPVSQICIPERIAGTWHPCSRQQEVAKYGKDYIDDGREVLEDYDFNDFYSPRRSLATKGYDKCAEKVYFHFIALVSAYGIHQLHIFIFVLAVFHILYCIITYALGKTKMKKWKSWERETKTIEYQYANDPERFRFARDTSFGRRHLNIWSKYSFTLWTAHMPAGSEARFDFQKYIQRSLEEDFKAVVGLRIQDKGDVVKGAPVVEPGDDLFWFGRPRFILFLIHLVLFTNAFQLAFFVWSTYEFTLKNCFHDKTEDIAIRITMGVLIQVVCSYITLPLYALVTQMGTSMRPTIFNDRVVNALKKWHNTAKKQTKHGNSGSNTPLSSRPTTPTHGTSPRHHLLHKHNRSLDNQTSFTASTSPRFSDFGGQGHGHQPFDLESQNVSSHLEIAECDNSNSQHPHADVASPVREEIEITEHVKKVDLPEFTFKK